MKDKEALPKWNTNNKENRRKAKPLIATKSYRVERAEIFREKIIATNVSQMGLARMLGVLMAHIEQLKNPDEEHAIKLLVGIAEQPDTFIDALKEVSIENGEVEEE